jgi:plastocyanin
MSRFVRAHRLVVSAVVLVVVTLGAGSFALATADAGARDSAREDGVLGPGPVTVTIDVDHSRFVMTPIRVRPHTDVRFVVRNHDPIAHELIVGGPDVQLRHEDGHEAAHPPVPGEVSVPALGKASTTYTFHAPGPVEYACHLPGHYQYGMHGVVDVVASASRGQWRNAGVVARRQRPVPQ